ncbi:MAG: SLBB domain-containing protein [Planctomycetota bacterium]
MIRRCIDGLLMVVCVLLLCAPLGCNQPESRTWMKNGFFDPSQVGNFSEQKQTEIRSALSILEEPAGIQNTEEPSPEDLQARYVDQKISPGDTINISILELLNPGETFAQQLRVSNAGFETMPVLGRVRFAGLTTRELELGMKESLRTLQILEDAEVQVTLVDTRQQQFSIIGSVQRPGTFGLPTPEYRLLNALAEAGGLSPQLEKVYVFRRGPAGGPAMSATEMPTSQPATTTPAAFTMSDVSGSTATMPGSMPSSGPTTAADSMAGTIDELKILEGAPAQSQPVPKWDADRGEWIVDSTTSAPGAASSGPTGTLARLARTASGTAEEEKGVWQGEELASASRIIEVPVKELLEGDPRYNIVVRPFDVINIPPGNVGEYYLMGNAARPGAYELTGRRLTVKEAIAAGGGFGPLAWPSRADLIRRLGKDEEQVIQLDLDSIFAGTSPDFYLKPNDIVNVGTNAAAPFLAVLRNAFRLSYGFGFVYDRNFGDADSFQAKEQTKTRRLQEATQRGLPL